MGKIKIVVSDQQPFMIDGIIGFLGHYPDLYEVVGGGNDSNLLIVFYVQIMPDDFVMQLHRF